MADADPIQEFYTRHPYPPPVENLDRARDEWRDAARRRAEFHLLWPDRPYRTDFEILVAGCGTWQAAKYALTHPEAHVVGIDVSATSLEHTERLRAQYGLTNLDLVPLAIEDAAALARSFDLIVCTGVLHHLADPEAGLLGLGKVLRPGGALNLMVYGRHGRAGIEMLQAYCRLAGIGPSPDDLADLAATLTPLPPLHPATAALRGARDTRDLDALADALLNPRERSYSVPELFDALDRTGWAFGRWFWQAPYLPGCGAIAKTPHAARLATLPVRDQYAAVELWRGTLPTHTLIAHSTAERPRRPGASDATVPVRRPDTLCLQERLPPGAAAVLLNRSHPNADIILPIDRQQKRIVDAIDGRMDVMAIARMIGVPAAEAAALVDTLERYDQVVFDDSAVHRDHRV